MCVCLCVLYGTCVLFAWYLFRRPFLPFIHEQIIICLPIFEDFRWVSSYFSSIISVFCGTGNVICNRWLFYFSAAFFCSLFLVFVFLVAYIYLYIVIHSFHPIECVSVSFICVTMCLWARERAGKKCWWQWETNRKSSIKILVLKFICW